MKIVCIRHGRTADDERDIHQSPDSELSRLGQEQTYYAGLRLKKEHFDHVFVSPYRRTRETWAEISKHHPHVEPSFSELIVEVDTGIYKGSKRGPMHEEIERKNLPFGEFKPEGGESFSEVRERAERFWKELKEKEADTVLVVSHGGFLSLLYLHIKGMPLTKENYDKYHGTNTAVTLIEFSDGKGDILSLNDTSHLERK